MNSRKGGGGGGGEQKFIGGECLSPVAPNVNFYRLSDYDVPSMFF